jgi:hypothetical protein
MEFYMGVKAEFQKNTQKLLTAISTLEDCSGYSPWSRGEAKILYFRILGHISFCFWIGLSEYFWNLDFLYAWVEVKEVFKQGERQEICNQDSLQMRMQ